MKFYVYEHWRNDIEGGACFYVGKGKGRRAFALRTRGKHHKAIQEKLATLGLEVEIRIISQNMEEEAAYAFERERIAHWREKGAKLANYTDGGGGKSGFKRSEEWSKKAAVWLHRSPPRKGFKLSEETKRKMSEAKKGKRTNYSKEGYEAKSRKTSERMKGNTHNLGRKLSEEHKEKLRLNAIGNRSNTGRKLPIEQRIKMSISQKISQQRPELRRLRSDLAKARDFGHQEFPPEKRAKMSKSATGNNSALGKGLPKEVRDKMRAEQRLSQSWWGS